MTVVSVELADETVGDIDGYLRAVELAEETVGDIVGYLRAVELAEETDGGIVRRTWLHFGRNFGGTWLPLS